MMKTCRDCREEKPADFDHFYQLVTGRLCAYCKECHRKRAAQSVQRLRQERQVAGLPQNAYRDVREDKGYLDRHLRRRAVEAEWGARYLPDQTEPENLNDPKPVWRDLTNCFLRPQTKVSSWKTA